MTPEQEQPTQLVGISKVSSAFELRSIDEIYAEICDLYKADGRPWVIGFSGGKDSTAALQLVWQALARLPEADRTKAVHVISSDTLVESPVISAYIGGVLAKINAAARAQSMPFTAQVVLPLLGETFWVNMIGRGYPASISPIQMVYRPAQNPASQPFHRGESRPIRGDCTGTWSSPRRERDSGSSNEPLPQAW